MRALVCSHSVWTTTCEVDEYYDFLWTLLEQISDGGNALTDGRCADSWQATGRDGAALVSLGWKPLDEVAALPSPAPYLGCSRGASYKKGKRGSGARAKVEAELNDAASLLQRQIRARNARREKRRQQEEVSSGRKRQEDEAAALAAALVIQNQMRKKLAKSEVARMRHARAHDEAMERLTQADRDRQREQLRRRRDAGGVGADPTAATRDRAQRHHTPSQPYLPPGGSFGVATHAPVGSRPSSGFSRLARNASPTASPTDEGLMRAREGADILRGKEAQAVLSDLRRLHARPSTPSSPRATPRMGSAPTTPRTPPTPALRDSWRDSGMRQPLASAHVGPSWRSAPLWAPTESPGGRRSPPTFDGGRGGGAINPRGARPPSQRELFRSSPTPPESPCPPRPPSVRSPRTAVSPPSSSPATPRRGSIPHEDATTSRDATRPRSITVPQWTKPRPAQPRVSAELVYMMVSKRHEADTWLRKYYVNDKRASERRRRPGSPTTVKRRRPESAVQWSPSPPRTRN